MPDRPPHPLVVGLSNLGPTDRDGPAPPPPLGVHPGEAIGARRKEPASRHIPAIGFSIFGGAPPLPLVPVAGFPPPVVVRRARRHDLLVPETSRVAPPSDAAVPAI